MEAVAARTMTLWDAIEVALLNIAQLAVAYSFSILGALILLVAGYIVAGLVERWAYAAMGRVSGFDETLRRFFSKTVRYAVLVFVGVTVLAQFGVQTASIIAALGAAGLAIGPGPAGHAAEHRCRHHDPGAAAVPRWRIHYRRRRFGRRAGGRAVRHRAQDVRRHLHAGSQQPALEHGRHQLSRATRPAAPIWRRASPMKTISTWPSRRSWMFVAGGRAGPRRSRHPSSSSRIWPTAR